MDLWYWSLDKQAHKVSPIIISLAPNKSLLQWNRTAEGKNEVKFRILLKIRNVSLRPPHALFTVERNCSESLLKHISSKLTCTFNISDPFENYTSFWANMSFI